MAGISAFKDNDKSNKKLIKRIGLISIISCTDDTRGESGHGLTLSNPLTLSASGRLRLAE